VSERPRVGSVEEWDIINLSAQSTHPIHFHLVQFQILNRQSINVDPTNGYPAAWNAAFGSSANPVNLSSTCTPGQFCPDFGPPLPYNTLNTDGAVGGNPGLHDYLSGDKAAPDPGESGWKDTATIYPSQVLKLLIRWTPTDTPVRPNRSYAGRNFYPFDPTQGYYVWHCHIIDHEDNEMMRPLQVTW